MASTNDPKIVVRSLTHFVEQVVRKITLDVVANLTASPTEGGTPVDTGWARANWIPSLGGPRANPAGTRENVTAAPQQAALDGLLRYRLSLGAVYVSNGVPYVVFLNEGSSAQAPAGFVQDAIDKAILHDLTRALRGGRL